MSIIQETAMIVRLGIGQWTARKFDKVVSGVVTRNFQAAPDAGRWNKLLIAKNELSKISSIVSQARTFHYENTVPWDDAGGRMLPSKNYMAYSEKMRTLRRSFTDAWTDFVENRYEDLKKEAEVRLGAMFSYSDYPSKAELYRKYRFDVDIDPVPNVDDFRISLKDSEAKQIKKDLEARISERVSAVSKDLFDRLIKVIGSFHEKAVDSEAIFRDSLVQNIEDLVELLPKLNVGDDPQINSAIKEIRKKVLVFSPEQLRKDKVARKVAANDAQKILDKMAGYIGSK